MGKIKPAQLPHRSASTKWGGRPQPPPQSGAEAPLLHHRGRRGRGVLKEKRFWFFDLFAKREIFCFLEIHFS
jgi:hypothetical protein